MTRFAVKEPKVLVLLQSSLTLQTAGSFIMFVTLPRGAGLVNVIKKKKKFKGIVPPKMKILSLITHPHVPNCEKLLLIFGTQMKIFSMKSESFLSLH